MTYSAEVFREQRAFLGCIWNWASGGKGRQRKEATYLGKLAHKLAGYSVDLSVDNQMAVVVWEYITFLVYYINPYVYFDTNTAHYLSLLLF